jgi:putative nucleotidyltransferase with HDIG domain
MVQPQVEKLWKHSILVASLSYVLAKKRTRLNPDEAMLAGLLHDIGEFYILTRVKDYPDLFADEAATNEIIANWHAEVGRAILESWEIPEEIATAVQDHEVFDRIHPAPADLTDVIMAANILSGEDMPESLNWETAPPAFGQLRLDSETCSMVMLESEEEMKQIALALG